MNVEHSFRVAPEGDPAGRTTVRIVGRLDALEALGLRDAFGRLHDEGHHRLLVDLSGTTYVDSAGLAALVKAMKDARRAGGDLELIRPRHADARRIFELTGFDRIFAMHDEVAAVGRG